MYKAFVLLSMCAVIIPACTTEKETKTEAGKYPVTNPIIIDTVLTNEYVADIQSIQNVEIRARLKGYIEAIHVDEGKLVKAGQVLFSIGRKQYQQELSKAQAVLKSVQAEQKAIELEVKNVRTLVDKNVVSETELEMAQAKLETAKAKVDEARADEAAAELSLSLTEIRAPYDGIINRIPNKTGSLVDEGTLLTTISNNKEVYAYFNVSEREYLDISKQRNESEKAQVDLLLVNNTLYPLKGTIETVEGEFDKTTGNIAFRAKFPNPDELLKHGSSGKILVKKKLERAMVIPQKSTFEIQENTYVFIVDNNNTVRMKKFRPGARIQNLFVVQSGLTTADRILFEGIQLVKEGDKIEPEPVKSGQVY